VRTRVATAGLAVLALALTGCSATKLVSGSAAPAPSTSSAAASAGSTPVSTPPEPPASAAAASPGQLLSTPPAPPKSSAVASPPARPVTTPTKPKPVTTKPAAPVFDTSAPCAGNTRAQFVVVVIKLQHAWMCTGATLVYESPVTTGATATDDGTPIGTWHVQGKQSPRTLRTRDGGSYHVQYWMPYDGDYGFHDAAWQTFPEGSALYTTQGSHGCVHLPAAGMAWLYNWARVGATVTVRA